MYKTYNAKRQLVNSDEFLDKSGDYYLMCISASMIYALRVFAKTRLKWESTFAKTQYQQGYDTPSPAEMDQIDDIVSEFIADTERIEMCNQALISALESIAGSIRLSSCCYEAGPGVQQIDGDWYFGTEEPLDAPASFGPGEEFETQSEYQTHKCAVANGIVNGIIGTLNGFALLSLTQLTAAAVVAGMVGLGLIFVPPIAIITAIVVAGLALATLSSIADEVDDNRFDVVCLLYNSDSATDAYDSLRAKMDEIAVDVGVLEIAIPAFLDLIMNLAPIDTMNALFSSVGLPEVPGEQIDCTLCGGCSTHYVGYGTYNPATKTLTAEYRGLPEDRWDALIRFFFDSTLWDYCGPAVTVNSVTENNPTRPNTVGDNGHRLYKQDGTLIYEDNDPPASIVDVGRYYGVDDTGSYSVTIDWEE